MVSSFENILGSTEAREVGKELYLVIQSTVSSLENILRSTEAREVGKELYLVIQRTVSILPSSRVMTPPSAMLLPLYWMLMDSGGTEEGTVRKKEEQSVVF
jgi:hypothetical protein